MLLEFQGSLSVKKDNVEITQMLQESFHGQLLELRGDSIFSCPDKTLFLSILKALIPKISILCSCIVLMQGSADFSCWKLYSSV